MLNMKGRLHQHVNEQAFAETNGGKLTCCRARNAEGCVAASGRCLLKQHGVREGVRAGIGFACAFAGLLSLESS